MSVKLLTEHHLAFLNFKGGAQAHLSIHVPKCHIVENHMSHLKYIYGHFPPTTDSRKVGVSYRRKYEHERLVSSLL